MHLPVSLRKALHKWHVLIPIGVFCINILIKVKNLGVNNLAGDEPYSVFHAQLSIFQIIQELSGGNNPPLYELLLHFWIKVFGISEFAVRFPSMVFSSLTAMMVYLLMRRVSTIKWAIWASMFFTLSNYHMIFAHEARVYPLMVFLSTCSIYLWLRIWDDSEKKKLWWALGIVNVLLVYSHYFGFFIILVQGISVILLPRRVHFYTYAWRTLAGMVVAYAPNIPTFLIRFFDSSTQGTWVPPVENLGQLHHVYYDLTNNNHLLGVIGLVFIWLMLQNFFGRLSSSRWWQDGGTVVSIFFLFYSLSIGGNLPYFWKITGYPWAMTTYLIFIIGIVALALRSVHLSSQVKLLLLWFFLPLLTMFIASFWVPMFLNRYLIFFTPAFYMLLALGFRRLNQQLSLRLHWLFLALLVLSFRFNIPNNRDVKEAVAATSAAQQERNNSVIIVAPQHFDIGFAYYFDRQIFASSTGPDFREKLGSALAKKNVWALHYERQIDSLSLNEVEYVVFLDAGSSFLYPGKEVEQFLDYRGTVVQEATFPDMFSLRTYALNMP